MCVSRTAVLLLLLLLQDNNAIVRTFGTPRTEEKLYNHVDLVQLLVSMKEGAPRAWGGGVGKRG